MNAIVGLFLLCLLFLLFILILAIILYLFWAYTRSRFPFGPSIYPPAEYYIQDQIILTGPGTVLDNLAAQLSGTTLVSLVRLDRLPFSELGEGIKDCFGLPAPAEGLVIDLYQIRGLLPNVERAIRRINRVLGNQAGVVIKDPNWLTGKPFDPEGSPFDPEGSPFEPAGSPFDPEGSSTGPVTKLANPDDFMAQWAFQVIDLAAGRFNAEGIHVGIFDSSPFDNVTSDTLVHKVIAMTGMPVTELGEFSLDVLHPTPSAKPAPSKKRNIDVRNHGFFIAGLIHAVAPQSQLRLVRVLGNDNRGDLFTLLKAIFNFLKENQREELTGQVINLSLGVRLPPEEAKFGLPVEILSLKYLMSAARCLGAVVVAAAGNDSYEVPLPFPSNLPGGWPTGLGVAATNIKNLRACFSNQGRLAAPGGDGRSEKQSDPDCKPRNDECTDEDYSLAIVGPIIQPPYKDDNNNGYIFWSGSSFSTPLVSGLAALVIRAGGGSLSPSEVESLILCGCTPTGDPYLGSGVINIRRTLLECLPANPEATQKGKEAAKKK
jgi:subtilisin family serine protease